MNLAQAGPLAGQAGRGRPSFKQMLEKDPKNLMATLAGCHGRRAQGQQAPRSGSIKASAIIPIRSRRNWRWRSSTSAASDYGEGQGRDGRGGRRRTRRARAGQCAWPGHDRRARTCRAPWPASKKPCSSTPKADGFRAEPCAGAAAEQATRRARLRRRSTTAQVQAQVGSGAGAGAATSLQAGDLERATGYVERMRQAAPDSQCRTSSKAIWRWRRSAIKEALAFYEKADPAAEPQYRSWRELRRRPTGQGAAAGEGACVMGREESRRCRCHRSAGRVRSAAQATATVRSRCTRQALARRRTTRVLQNNLAMLYLDRATARALATRRESLQGCCPRRPAIAGHLRLGPVQAGQDRPGGGVLERSRKGPAGQCRGAVPPGGRLAPRATRAEAVAADQESHGVDTLPPAVRSRRHRAAGRVVKVVHDQDSGCSTICMKLAPRSVFAALLLLAVLGGCASNTKVVNAAACRRPGGNAANTASARATRCRCSSGTSRNSRSPCRCDRTA